MIKLTENTIKPSTEEILSIRKFLSEKFGHQRASDIWFGYFLKNFKKAEKLDKLNDAKGVAFVEGIIKTEKENENLKELLSIKEAQLLGCHSSREKLENIEKLMIHNGSLGGRMTLDDTEQVMYILTGQYHNSKCPDCGKPVSCVCTSECNHIWYCPDHILDHSHRQIIGDSKN